MKVSSEQEFAAIVARAAARAHQVHISPDAATCLHCGGVARDLRGAGLPWVDVSALLVLACEGRGGAK